MPSAGKKGLWPCKSKAVALDRAIASCYHWLYHSNEVELLSDCKGLSGMREKYLVDIHNKKLHKIFKKAAYYNWKLTHIKGKK